MNYARICSTHHTCRISAMSIISNNISTSNTTSTSINSSCRAEIRSKTSRATTSMHPLTSTSRIIHSTSNTQRLQTRSNQCQRIQLFRPITWMPWAMAYRLLRATRRIYSLLRIPAQWSCIMLQWETKALIQRPIHPLHSMARTTLTSFSPRATRCSSTQRHLTRCHLIYTRSIHRLEHLRAVAAILLAITTSTLSTISLSVWKTLLFQLAQAVKLIRSSTRTCSRPVRRIKHKPSSQLASDTSIQKMIIKSSSTIMVSRHRISTTFQTTGPRSSIKVKDQYPLTISATKQDKTYTKCEGIRSNNSISNMIIRVPRRKTSKISQS